MAFPAGIAVVGIDGGYLIPLSSSVAFEYHTFASGTCPPSRPQNCTPTCFAECIATSESHLFENCVLFHVIMLARGLFQ